MSRTVLYVSAENAPMLLPAAAADRHSVCSDVVFLTKKKIGHFS
jgi:hypothetical protein